VTWEELPDVEMLDFTIDTMPARFARLGDLWAGMDEPEAVFGIEPLLEWAERDERDRGLGDAPYPPNFPKQEGEPPRVQPSRMKKANWVDRDRPSDVMPQDLD
jgi:DNA primase